MSSPHCSNQYETTDGAQVEARYFYSALPTTPSATVFKYFIVERSLFCFWLTNLLYVCDKQSANIY